MYSAQGIGLKKKKRPKTQEQKMQTPKHQIQTKLIFPSRENQKKKLQIKALSVFHLRNINGTNIYCNPKKDR